MDKIQKRGWVWWWWRRRRWWWWWSHQNLLHKKQGEGRVISMLPFPSSLFTISFKQICFLVMHYYCCCYWTDLKSSSDKINCKHTKENTWILMKIHMTSKYEKSLCFCLYWQNILLKILHPEREREVEKENIWRVVHSSLIWINYSFMSWGEACIISISLQQQLFFSRRGNQRERGSFVTESQPDHNILLKSNTKERTERSPSRRFSPSSRW